MECSKCYRKIDVNEKYFLNDYECKVDDELLKDYYNPFYCLSCAEEYGCCDLVNMPCVDCEKPIGKIQRWDIYNHGFTIDDGENEWFCIQCSTNFDEENERKAPRDYEGYNGIFTEAPPP